MFDAARWEFFIVFMHLICGVRKHQVLAFITKVPAVWALVMLKHKHIIETRRHSIYVSAPFENHKQEINSAKVIFYKVKQMFLNLMYLKQRIVEFYMLATNGRIKKTLPCFCVTFGKTPGCQTMWWVKKPTQWFKMNIDTFGWSQLCCGDFLLWSGLVRWTSCASVTGGKIGNNRC